MAAWGSSRCRPLCQDPGIGTLAFPGNTGHSHRAGGRSQELSTQGPSLATYYLSLGFLICKIERMTLLMVGPWKTWRLPVPWVSHLKVILVPALGPPVQIEHVNACSGSGSALPRCRCSVELFKITIISIADTFAVIGRDGIQTQALRCQGTSWWGDSPEGNPRPVSR